MSTNHGTANLESLIDILMNKSMEKRRDDLCVQQWDMYLKGTTRYTDEHIKATQGATDRCSGIAVGFNAAAEIYEKEKIAPLELKIYQLSEEICSMHTELKVQGSANKAGIKEGMERAAEIANKYGEESNKMAACVAARKIQQQAKELS